MIREKKGQILKNRPTVIFMVFTVGYFLVPSALPPKPAVSGYECGRVFPAGVGPGSPSRDAANWLPSS